MDRKLLPIGEQSFRRLRERGCLYVDKTSYIDMLMREGAPNFFLSRPRRFGKSLFVDTLNEAFDGSKELFEGLDLFDKWD